MYGKNMHVCDGLQLVIFHPVHSCSHHSMNGAKRRLILYSHGRCKEATYIILTWTVQRRLILYSHERCKEATYIILT